MRSEVLVWAGRYCIIIQERPGRNPMPTDQEWAAGPSSGSASETPGAPRAQDNAMSCHVNAGRMEQVTTQQRLGEGCEDTARGSLLPPGLLLVQPSPISKG